MSISRIYQAQDIAVDQLLTLDEEASHHIARVLRAKIGDQVQIFNGTENAFIAIIREITKHHVLVYVQAVMQPATESLLNLSLAQGIARGEKMDWIVQKAVELGVQTIYPLLSERCNVQLSGDRLQKKIKHWQAIAVSACEQSGRIKVPKIFAPMDLQTYLTTIVPSARTYILSPHVQGKLCDEKLSAINIIIGPEGGLSDAEIKLAIENGCEPLNLGPRILRTETASIVALTMLQYKFGDI